MSRLTESGVFATPPGIGRCRQCGTEVLCTADPNEQIAVGMCPCGERVMARTDWAPGTSSAALLKSLTPKKGDLP